MRCAGAALLAAALGGLAPGQVLAQDAAPLRVSAAVAPETVTVGERFRSVVQLVIPSGAEAEFSPLPMSDSLQPVDSMRVIPARGGEPPIAAYSLVAWVADAPLSAQVPVRVTLPDGTAATYLIPLRLPVVRSVLPADTAGVRPRPARGLLPVEASPRRWWPWLLLLAALIGAAAFFWLRRRSAPAEPTTARERALAELARLEREWSAGRCDADTLYPVATRALRGYLAEESQEWGADLTTRELLERLQRDALGPEPREALAFLLGHADRVKFARYAPPAAEVGEFLSAARAWIARYPAPPVPPETREAA